MSKGPGASQAGQRKGELERTLGFRQALAIGRGTMVGAGIFVFPGLPAGTAGPGAMLSFAISAVVAMLVARRRQSRRGDARKESSKCKKPGGPKAVPAFCESPDAKRAESANLDSSRDRGTLRRRFAPVSPPSVKVEERPCDER